MIDLVFAALALIVIILIIFFSVKNKKKKSIKLLQEYKSLGSDYIGSMETDLNALYQQKQEIDILIKEYNGKKDYISNIHNKEKNRVLNEANHKSHSNPSNANQYKQNANREANAISKQRSTELALLRSQYDEVFTRRSKVYKEISLLKYALKMAKDV